MPTFSSSYRRALPASLLAGALALTGCGTASESGGGSDVTVAASFYPLEFIAEEVGGDLIEVAGLSQPGQDPHDLELSVGQTRTLAGADLVLLEEALQPGIAKAVEQNGTGEVLDVEDVIDLAPLEEESGEEHAEDEAGHNEDEDEAGHAEEGAGHAEDEDEAGDGHEDHGDEDPHFWLDPLLMAELATAVGERLGEVDAENAQEYAANAADLAGRLEQLDADFVDGLADCERSTVVVSHDAFGYLARYDLDFHGIAGLSPDAEPTPADRAKLEELIREDGVTTVFSERLAPRSLAESLAQDIGVETATLDPVEGLTDETADEDYLSLMEQNLAALQQANGCR